VKDKRGFSPLREREEKKKRVNSRVIMGAFEEHKRKKLREFILVKYIPLF
jgi:hypothetical protein